jgi:hypothetical protein
MLEIGALSDKGAMAKGIPSPHYFGQYARFMTRRKTPFSEG